MTIGENTVGMAVNDVTDTVIRIVLNGRLDTPGVDSIETRFAATIVPTGKSAIVDISGVDFVASMGIRMLISVGRSMRQRHARLALYGAQPLVKETLDSVSLGEIIPVVGDEAAAIASVTA